jgi:hypothetical protein
LEKKSPVSTTIDGKKHNCSVAAIGEVKDSTSRITITCDSPIASSQTGKNVVLHITRATTGKKVLTVPIGAMTKTSSGADAVITVTGKNKLTRVEVKAGLSANGYIEITPIVSDALTAGERVVIGGK